MPDGADLAKAATPAKSRGPYLDRGKRLALVGRTGVGKTYLGKWFLLGNPQQWVILDTKADPSLDKWRPQTGLLDMRRLSRLWEEGRKAVVIRPRPEESGHRTLDAYLKLLHESFTDFGTFIDEMYQFQIGGKPGPGLVGLVSRGRVRQQTVIMGAQRPSWVPMFMFSEATYMAIMSLTLRDDKQRMYKATGRDEVYARLEPRWWLYFDVDPNDLKKYPPVTITG